MLSIRVVSKAGLRKARPVLLIAAVLLLVALSVHFSGSLPTTQGTAYATDLDSLPLSFEPNIGQTDPSVQFLSHTSNGTLYFTKSNVVLMLQWQDTPGQDVHSQALQAAPVETSSTQVPLHAVTLQLLGVQPGAIAGVDELPGRVNYFLGNDPSNWHTDIHTYASVTYSDLYKGIDLAYEGNSSQLKGTYTVMPGAEPNLIRWRYEGAKDVALDEVGNLRIVVAEEAQDNPQATLASNEAPSNPQIAVQAEDTTLTEHTPVAWQEIGAQRIPVAASYNVSSEGTVSFVLGSYDRAYPLVIDPALDYSTYLGGSGNEGGFDITVDSMGSAYIVGSTQSVDFPVQSPYQGNQDDVDVFITKLAVDGQSLLFSTYLGGSGVEEGYGLDLDDSNNIYLTGYTSSTNFPTLLPVQITNAGGDSDAFVTKLNSTGSGLQYSTYLGGGVIDRGYAIAVDATGNAYVTGDTNSHGQSGTPFPAQNGYDSCTPGGDDFDAFVTRLTFSGTALTNYYSTCLGGIDQDPAFGIAADDSGNAYIAGFTASYTDSFPIRNAFQSSRGGGYAEGFVAKLNTLAIGDSSLVYSSYLGGNFEDEAYDITIDEATRNAYVTGSTNSTTFPTAGTPYQTALAGCAIDCEEAHRDAFVSKVSASGTSLLYSTYLGGTGDEGAFLLGAGIALDSSNNVYVIGSTTSTDFPTLNPVQGSNRGTRDIYVTKLNPSVIPAQQLKFSTYLGGSGEDTVGGGGYVQPGKGIAVDSSGNMYVTGWTYSTDFTLSQSPYQSINRGGYDAFVARINSPDPNPPTPTPGPVAPGSAPRVDGSIAVWEDGTGDIKAKDLVTGVPFTVTQDLVEQAHPDVSAGRIVWQQRSSPGTGNWDIYGAIITNTITNTIVSGPTPVYMGPGDQVNPVVSHNLVVWQSSQSALATATPESAARWDIVGRNFSTGQVFTLTTGPNTHRNPAVDVYSVFSDTDPPFFYTDTISVWQSTALTTTSTPQATPWAIMGAMSIASPNPPTFVVPGGNGDQTNPDVSGRRVVWQELHSQDQIIPGEAPGTIPDSHGRWSVRGFELPVGIDPGITFTVTDRLDTEDRTYPAISGSRVAYQNNTGLNAYTPESLGGYTVMFKELGKIGSVIGVLTTITVTAGLTSAPMPDISNNQVVWQQSPGGLEKQGVELSTSEIYSSVNAPYDLQGDTTNPTGSSTTLFRTTGSSAYGVWDFGSTGSSADTKVLTGRCLGSGVPCTGVYGSGTGAGAGVYGSATSGNGVYGTATNGGVALFGDNTGTGTGFYGFSSGGPGGVMGSQVTEGARFYTRNSSSYALVTGGLANTYGNVYVTGRVTATGGCCSTVETNVGTRQMYANEGARSIFSDQGVGTLVNGHAVIMIDPLFAQGISLTEDYQVFLTPGSLKTMGLGVINKTATSFEVGELNGGTGNFKFDWRLDAARKGHETERMAPAPAAPASTGTAYEVPQNIPTDSGK